MVIFVCSIYGHASYSGPWTMVKLNFSQVLSRQCDEPTDYENWMASDHDTVSVMHSAGKKS